MLIYHRSSILKSKAQTVVNTVNCVGVMGKGLAAEFKKRYPQMYRTYKDICENKLLEPGKLWLWQGPDQWVLNFPTKKHWKNPSRLEWIEAGLNKFVSEYQHRGIREISFPRLGCGNGGLDWEDVRPLMETYLGHLSIPIFIHDYEVDLGLPEHLEDLVRGEFSAPPAFTNFHEFSDVLKFIVESSSGCFAELMSGEKFHAALDQDDGLIVELSAKSLKFDSDDLRGFWIALLNGMLSRERIHWSVGEGAEEIFTILAHIPGTRVVQIQSSDSEQPDRAIELLSLGGAQNISNDAEQLKISWA